MPRGRGACVEVECGYATNAYVETSDTCPTIAQVKRTTYFSIDSYITVVSHLATPFLAVGNLSEFHVWYYGDTILTSDSLHYTCQRGRFSLTVEITFETHSDSCLEVERVWLCKSS